MARIVRSLWVAFMLLLYPAFGSCETVSLAADLWPPFNAEPGGDAEGFMVDVAREAFRAEGIALHYELLPWKRAISLAREGAYNGLIGASRTDAPDFVFPDEELSRNHISFYVRREFPWRFTERRDVAHVSLGVIAGYDYRTWLLAYISAQQRLPGGGTVQVMTGDRPLHRNIEKLLAGRIDAVVDNGAVIRHVARQMGVLDRITPAGSDHEVSYIYIAFSPNHPESRRYADILSHGIRALRSDGRLAAILARYGLTDWKPSP